MTKTESQRRITVLAYHHIGEPPPEYGSWYYVPKDVFTRQLRELSGLGWTVIDAATFVACLEDPDRLPARSALITFDDAYRSVHDLAMPVLQSFQYPAVCFVPTDYVGAWNSWDEGTEPRAPICGWDELQALLRAGVSIQAHGTSHTWLSLLDASRQKEEVQQSKLSIEAHLGGVVDLFAYPYSDAGEDRGKMAGLLEDTGYRAAFLCGGGPAAIEVPIRERYHLDRIAMYPGTNLGQELSA